MRESQDDYGIKAVNYRSEPLWGRRGGDPSIDFGERNEFDYAGVLSSKEQHNNEHFSPVATEETISMGFGRDPEGLNKEFRCQAGVAFLKQENRYLCDPETPVFVATVGSEVQVELSTLVGILGSKPLLCMGMTGILIHEPGFKCITVQS